MRRTTQLPTTPDCLKQALPKGLLPRHTFTWIELTKQAPALLVIHPESLNPSTTAFAWELLILQTEISQSANLRSHFLLLAKLHTRTDLWLQALPSEGEGDMEQHSTVGVLTLATWACAWHNSWAIAPAWRSLAAFWIILAMFCMLQLPYISIVLLNFTYFVEGLETGPRVGNWTIFLMAVGICGMARNYVLQFKE